MGICKSNVEGISPEDIIVGDCALSYERSRWIIAEDGTTVSEADMEEKYISLKQVCACM